MAGKKLSLLKNSNNSFLWIFGFFMVAAGSVAIGQSTDRIGPSDFITTDIYEINEGSIQFGFVSSAPVSDSPDGVGKALPMRLKQPLEKGTKLQLTGHSVMYQRGVPKVFYSVNLVEGSESNNLRQNVGSGDQSKSQTLYINAEDLVRGVGADLYNCDVLPSEALAYREQEGRGVRPRRRPRNTLQENLQDIAAVRDGVYDELNIQVPALNFGVGKNDFDPRCVGYIQGKNQLGPWGEFIVQEIIGTYRGEPHHVDVDPKYFFDVPKGYFGDACPNFNNMSTGQKLGLWVTAISSLSMKESNCDVEAINPSGTNNKALGLLQNDAPWKTRTLSNGRVIIGRQNRGEGCNAKTQEAGGYWLLDFEDALSCGIQNLGDISCGGYSRNFGKKPVCRPQSRPSSFFGKRKVSNQEFGPLKGGTPSDRRKQAWIKQQMRKVPGCI